MSYKELKPTDNWGIWEWVMSQKPMKFPYFLTGGRNIQKKTAMT